MANDLFVLLERVALLNALNGRCEEHWDIASELSSEQVAELEQFRGSLTSAQSAVYNDTLYPAYLNFLNNIRNLSTSLGGRQLVPPEKLGVVPPHIQSFLDGLTASERERLERACGAMPGLCA